MLRRLAYSHAAARDFTAILRFISQRSCDDRAGLRYVQLLREQCQKLAELRGTLGRPRDELAPGLRSFPFQGYVILFRYEPDRLLIVNVVEGRRDLAAFLGKGG
ncbi:type II toxin-antitoxin system RelE/ParE family toxin [Niveispirillum sp. KHB5.9]|uniref:type II toxin-antitoxin system RelE/ParE family toxin n=1 Tax=Niveispirillum sp. KHB5.9 TaxID=3400269 RepID=UPI003A894BA6